MREGTNEQGFTLVELMVVIAIVAILGLVVVPTFMGEGRKAKSSTEVTPMLAELANREHQYKQENAVFLPAAACPATPSKTEQDVSGCLASGQPWASLRVQPHAMKLRCSYQIGIGTASTNPATSITAATGTATFPNPTTIPATQAESWFFILAKCDADGDGQYAQFFSASWDTRIQKKDPGE